MGLLAWIKKRTHAESLIAAALVEFAEGDQKEALGNLLQGLIEMAAGTNASVVLYNLQTRMANFNLIPHPATIPMQSALPASVTPPSPTK
jgi:hypothetical protein